MLKNRIAVKIAFFINGFIFSNWVSRLPRIQEVYGADNGTIGLVLLALSIGAVGAMPFTGWIIMKNGSQRITKYSAILYCGIVPFIPFTQNIFGLTVLFFLLGIVTGVFDVAMNAQAVIVERTYKKSIITSFHALFSIGMMVGAWCGAAFIQFGQDIDSHFLIVPVITAAVAWWTSRNLVVDKPTAETIHKGPLFRLPNQFLLGIGIIAFCCMLAEGAMSDWSVNYMQNIAEAGKTLSPIGLSAFAGAMTLGRLFGDRIRSWLGDKKMIVLGSVISLFGLSLALVFATPSTSIAGFFLVGLGLSSIVPITYSIAGNTKGLPSGVGLAMVTTVGYSGFLFGPPIIGFIADWSNLRAALSVVLVLLIIMTVLGANHKPDNS